MSVVIAIKPFEETRQAWSSLSDHAATVTSVIRRLVAGEIDDADLAIPESYSVKPGVGFDKQRNPNWFQGLYGRALSRTCLSARIPADLYDALQAIKDWQDTLRKALHNLVAGVALPVEKVDDVSEPVEFLWTSKAMEFEELDAFQSFYYKYGEQRVKLLESVHRYGATEEYMDRILDLGFDDFIDRDIYCSEARDLLDKRIAFWLKNFKKSSANVVLQSITNHILRGLRMLRTEVINEVGY